MSEHKGVLLISYMRSGTHILKDLISKNMGLKDMGIVEPTADMIDQINFTFNSDRKKFLTIHLEPIEYFNQDQMDRLNSIIENRNIHVILLDRKDFVEHVMSRIIFNHFLFNSSARLTKKVYIKKQWVELEYRSLYRLKNYNLNRMKLKFHEHIFYEDFLKNGFEFNGDLLTIDDLDNKGNPALIKNPPKKNLITNYDKVMKWMDEFSKIYKEGWVPFYVWGKD